jgi:hypothetical protein
VLAPLWRHHDRSFSTSIALPCSSGVDSKNALSQISTLRRMVRCVALVCMVLTFWSAFAFAAHHHAKGTESVKCTLCVAAHSAAPEATAHLVNATFAQVSTFRAEPVSARERFVIFALSIRPPPAI